MKKFRLRDLKRKTIDINELDDRALFLNLYITQFATLLIGLIIVLFQRNNPLRLLAPADPAKTFLWGAGFAAVVLAGDFLISRFVPEEVTDDGGVNERLFGNGPVWHIVLISLVVSICEEFLFRGAIQHAWGPYWTSILFAAIHIRYLQHWLMTGMVFGISYGLGWIYLQSGTLWSPILAHFVIDLTMGLILRFGGRHK